MLILHRLKKGKVEKNREAAGNRTQIAEYYTCIQSIKSQRNVIITMKLKDEVGMGGPKSTRTRSVGI